jgi:hypothetical protein
MKPPTCEQNQKQSPFQIGPAERIAGSVLFVYYLVPLVDMSLAYHFLSAFMCLAFFVIPMGVLLLVGRWWSGLLLTLLAGLSMIAMYVNCDAGARDRFGTLHLWHDWPVPIVVGFIYFFYKAVQSYEATEPDRP